MEQQNSTYTHKWKCPNCNSSNSEKIPRGVTIQDFDPECGECGCTVNQFWKDKR